MVLSGSATWSRVSPLWPFCPPDARPDGSRELLTRDGFLSPSLDGGLPLLELFNPSRRSSSAICAFKAAISAACAATSATNSSRRSEEHTSELQSLAYLVCRL